MRMTDVVVPQLAYIRSFLLKHSGECCLLAISPDLHIFAEEIYGEDGWLAQHHLDSDGNFVESIDEDSGSHQVTAPLDLPDDSVRPASGWQTMWLNFAGPRHRGMRTLERVDELVRPFTVQDKMRLSQHPALNDVPQMMLLGLAESYVLAEARTAVPGLYFVCRRLRLAYRLAEARIDEDGEPYDYDSRVLYIAHFAAHHPALDDSLVDQMLPLPGLTPARPMDCAIFDDHLLVADGSNGDQPNAIHLWKITSQAEILSTEEKLRRKIYG